MPRKHTTPTKGPRRKANDKNPATNASAQAGSSSNNAPLIVNGSSKPLPSQPAPAPLPATEPLRHTFNYSAGNGFMYDGFAYSNLISSETYTATVAFGHMCAFRQGYHAAYTMDEWEGPQYLVAGEVKIASQPLPLKFNATNRNAIPTANWLDRINKQLYHALSKAIGHPIVLAQLMEAVKGGQNAHEFLADHGR